MSSKGPPRPVLCVLGPLSLLVDGRPVPVGGPLPRRLLGALLVRRNAVVSVDRLIEVLWGDDPPDNTLPSVRTYVSRLRRVLPSSAHLETVAPGYRLVLDADTVDVDRFESVLAQGLGRSAQDPQTALIELGDALALWQGDAYAEFRDEWWARAEACRLDELRLHGREALAEAFLAVGRDEEAVSESRAITVDHPSRERAWRVLVLGLHRCGRQAEALRCASQYRARLRDESGLDPSKDFAALEHDVAVDATHLRRSPPPTPLAGTPRVNLSTTATTLVGRGEQLERLVAALAERRLVTVTGTGGVGKTRLATEAAWRAADEFPEGVWMCELAGVADPATVPHAVATTLAVRHQEGLSVLDSIVDALGGRRALLILDNCEHVLDAAAEVAERLTRGCPTVRVLTTSRAPLGVAGERVWALASLPAVEGVELFCDRAADADASFAPNEAELAVIAAICARLDGLPLAIELAAARVRSMTLADVADRLDDRFRLLRSGRRGGSERHQTLQGTVEWSYQLLADDERLLFDRLAVFASSFDLAAARAVCGDARVGRLEVGDLLVALVDKSMIVADLSGAHARYRVLETLRQYGEERQADGDERAILRDRHLGHFAQVASRCNQQVKSAAYAEGVAVFEVEWDNLRTALLRAVAIGDAACATGLVEALLQFAVWQQRHELGDWAERVIGVDGAGPGAFGVAAMFASLRGDHDGAVRLARTGIAAATPATHSGLRLCTEMKGRALWYSGHVAEGWAALQTWDSSFDPAEEPFDAAWAAVCLSSFALVADPLSVAGHVARARRIAAPLANPALATNIVWAAGLVERAAGRYDVALAHFRQAIDLGVRTGNLYLEGFATLSIGFTATMSGAKDATRVLRHALTRLYATRTWMNTWVVVEALALYWARTFHQEPAAVLLGHLEARDIRHPGAGAGAESFIVQRERALAALHALPETDSWMSRGAQFNRDELVAYALSHLVDSAPAEES